MYSFQYRSRDYGAVDVLLKPRAGQRFPIDLIGEISYVIIDFHLRFHPQ